MPLADACVTEWRGQADILGNRLKTMPLADACVTEWRLVLLQLINAIGMPLADAVEGHPGREKNQE